MKTEINPVVGVIIVVAVVIVAGVFLYVRSNRDVVTGPTNVAKVNKANK